MDPDTTGDSAIDESGPRPPARLRQLASWQSNKVSVLGARLTAQHMPLTARGEFAVLAALEEYGALSQADLGRLLGLDRNEVSGIVTRLEDNGGIDRQPDPADRRRNVVTLTAEGERRLEQIQRYADAAQQELLAGLDPAERDQLIALLAKVLAGPRPPPGRTAPPSCQALVPRASAGREWSQSDSGVRSAATSAIGWSSMT